MSSEDFREIVEDAFRLIPASELVETFSQLLDHASNVGGNEMAESMLGSLRALQTTIESHKPVRDMWREDPVKCLAMSIRVLEARHIRGETNEQIEKGVI